MEKILKYQGVCNVSSTSTVDPEAYEGQHTLSWIWLATSSTGAESGGAENMQRQCNESKFQNCPH
jgi:hypothetical protein